MPGAGPKTPTTTTMARTRRKTTAELTRTTSCWYPRPKGGLARGLARAVARVEVARLAGEAEVERALPEKRHLPTSEARPSPEKRSAVGSFNGRCTEKRANR